MSGVRIKRPQDAEQGLSDDDVRQHYTGPAELRRVHQALGTTAVAINVVTFAAGSRTLPHTHSSDQVIYIASGVAVVAVDGGEDQRVEAGEFVLLPASLPHMHGAADDVPAVHFGLIPSVDTDWDCPLPDSWAHWRRR